METDGRYMMENNYRYSLDAARLLPGRGDPAHLRLVGLGVRRRARCSARRREHEAPLNVYGYSKFLFDQVVRRRLPDAPAQVAGFRYFNVYGPNEAHKGRMASVAFHFFNQYRGEGRVKLFEGSDGYADGEQRRDFVSVEDVVKVNLHFLEQPERSGIFNVGTGRAQTLQRRRRARRSTPAGAPRASRRSRCAELQAQGAIEYIAVPRRAEGQVPELHRGRPRRAARRRLRPRRS